jgi:uncharacterized protein
MRVNIDEIKDAGLDRSWDLTREQLDAVVADDRAGYRARAKAHVDAHLEKVERRVRVGVRGVAAVTAACGRCLAPVSLDVPLQFELTLVPEDEYEEEAAPHAEKDGHKGHAGGSFRAREAEEETYAGKTVDLDPFLREQIILALPAYPVCDESCKGLCPVCGANLNERECGCDRHVPDPRWAGLKNVKL